MNVSRKEFEAYKAKQEADMESSYQMIAKYFTLIDQKLTSIDSRLDRIEERLDRIEERLDRLEERVDKLEAKADRAESRLTALSEDVAFMRSDFGARFNIISGQLRVIDESSFRTDARLTALERRVTNLEEKAS